MLSGGEWENNSHQQACGGSNDTVVKTSGSSLSDLDSEAVQPGVSDIIFLCFNLPLYKVDKACGGA